MCNVEGTESCNVNIALLAGLPMCLRGEVCTIDIVTNSNIR